MRSPTFVALQEKSYVGLGSNAVDKLTLFNDVINGAKTRRSPTALQPNTGEESVEAQFRRADIDANV